MKLRQRRVPLFLLVLPSLALVTSALDSRPAKDAHAAGVDGASPQAPLDSTLTPSKKYEVGTKDAPVDGKDGMPHEGPFVTLDKGRKKTDTNEVPESNPLSTTKEKPAEPIVIDGKEIPESNDGVMDDPNRLPPKQGTTGTEGGVSQKDKAKKAKEGVTGEKVENIPETPKEKPPLPHSEQEKITVEKPNKKEKGKGDLHQTPEDIAGLEVGAPSTYYRCGIC